MRFLIACSGSAATLRQQKICKITTRAFALVTVFAIIPLWGGYLCPIMKHNEIIAESTRRNIRQCKHIRESRIERTPFEIWAEENWFLTPGKTLKLNAAQKHLLREFEKARTSRQPVSFAVPHASRLGITTFCEAYIYWLQNIDGIGDNAAMFYPDARAKKAGKYRFYRNANARLDKFRIDTRRVKHLSGNSVVYNTQSIVNSYYTVRQHHSARNLSPRYILCSDTANLTPRVWKEEYLLGCRREPLYNAYISTRPGAGYALTIFEGNTGTTGTHGFWFDILDNPAKLNFTKSFLPWYASEDNRRHLNCSLKEFYNSLSDYEYSVLWKQLNLTVKQICWYREAVSTLDDKRMIPAVYPSTEYEVRTRTLTDAPPRPPGSYILMPSYDNVHNPKSRTDSTQPPNIYQKAIVRIEAPPDIEFVTVAADNSAQPEKITQSAEVLQNPTPI